MENMLRVPVGIENFKEIRSADYYYVDKTRLIEQLLTDGGKVSLFTRPRRFGKTLNMSMLRCFFEIGTDPALFDGLYIYGNKKLCEAYLGKFPVIFLTLKDAEGTTFENAKYQLTELICTEIRRHEELRNSNRLDEDDKAVYSLLTRKKDGKYFLDDDTLSGSLKLLSELLRKHHQKDVVILIDEYDVPLDKAFQNGYYREMVSLMRSMFGKVLKTNDDLQLAVLTGCLRISKESIFTGMNNFKVLSIIDDRFDEQFGFTEDEVKVLLTYYHLETCMESMKEWYDGYRFGKADIYCPWDVINYLDSLRANPEARPRAYWINTSGNGLVKRFVDKADKTTRDEIEILVSGGSIEKQVQMELTYDEVDKSINNLWSILFTTGYLTQAEELDYDRYRLKIPNEEVRRVFVLQIQEWFQETILGNTEKLSVLWKAMEAGDEKTIEISLTRMLIDSISVRDTGGPDTRNENAYHMFLNGILAGNADWSVKSNIEAGEGYADIIVKPDDPDMGIIFELKTVTGINEMQEACEKAIRQIEEKHYADYLLDEGRQNILMYGIAFYKKRCKVKAKKAEIQTDIHF